MITNSIKSRIAKLGLVGVPFSLTLLAALGTGCTQDRGCAELGTCGGQVPVGQWELAECDAQGHCGAPRHPVTDPTADPLTTDPAQVDLTKLVICDGQGLNCGTPIPATGKFPVSHKSCSEDLYEPQTDPRLLGGEIQPARVQAIEPALFDWCDELVAGSGTKIDLEPAVFFYESAPIGRAFVKYKPDDPAHPERGGDFSAGMTRTGTYALDFPATCMRAFGASDGKPLDPVNDPMGATGNVCKQLEFQLETEGVGAGAYFNVTCDPNNGAAANRTTPIARRAGMPVDPYGCVCMYDLTSTGGPAGRYQMSDSHTIVHLLSGGFPTEATFCNKGTSLELTGAHGSYLFNLKGLRTMDLLKTGP
ncbi:MAG TPA: hypothetical protein VL137_06370 [Polyangiaceae bacterium]|nr:hypothetical protein [Polyangiaceae bacterium]